jgi:amidase
MRGTNGSTAFRDVVIEADSELVARHRRAGLVILGKTNTPEFGMNVCTNPTLFGPTRHPLDADRSVGGSSGGSGAVVAAGMLPEAHATDSGGSIRIPASNCGLFGLKPSRNRVPLGNDSSEGLAGLSTGHALTNSVRDSALLLDVTHGALAGDGGGPPAPSGRFVDALEAEPGLLRVGLLTEGFAGEAVHPDCVAAAENAATLLESLGHRVERVDG